MKFGRMRRSLGRRIALWWKRIFWREVLVLGDSHAQVFRYRRLRRAIPGVFFDVVSVGGATASGLANPNSKTQAYPLFRRALASSRAKVAVVVLGEVDTGFVIWYRAQKYQEPVAAMLEAAVINYARFLAELQERGMQVMVISTPLPTIRDDNDWGEVANQRREVRVPLRERTELTLEFNRRMREVCQQAGLTYIDLDQASLGPDGVVAAWLLNSNPRDHHYDHQAYARLLIDPLAALLAEPASTQVDQIPHAMDHLDVPVPPAA